MINIILIVFGGAGFLLCVYGLFKMLTTARSRVFEMVDGNTLAFLSLVAWMLTFIACTVYWIFSSIDFDAARNFKRYVHSFPAVYIFEGTLCLFLIYGLSKIKSPQLSDGKRSLIIIAGIFFGLLAIALGLKKIFGGA